MTRIITVTSGKGGVGKTNISVNLALYLANSGYRVCLFDADLGLANINILLGLDPEYDLEDVILNEKSIGDVLIRNYHGIDIIPGSSGIPMMADLEPGQLTHLIESLSMLNNYDFFLFDTSAGISKSVISFCMASDEVILVVTPEPTSLTDGYSLLKVLSLNGYNKSVMVTVNQCKNVRVSSLAFNKLKETVQQYLPIDILPFGTVVRDQRVVEAVAKQQAFVSLYPDTDASKCIKNIFRYLTRKKSANTDSCGVKAFWSRFEKTFTGPLQVPGRKMPESNRFSGLEETAHEKSADPNDSLENKNLSESEDLVLPAAAPQSSERGGQDQLIPDIQSLLSKLVENTSAISQELGAIRKAIQEKRQDKIVPLPY